MHSFTASLWTVCRSSGHRARGKQVSSWAVWLLAACGAMWSPAASRAESIEGLLQAFQRDWPDDRTPYRTEDDETWKTYAVTLKGLVAHGPTATAPLIGACDSESFQVRGMAARALGFLEAERAVPKLIELLEDQRDTVALHAADSLGQIRSPEAIAGLEKARTTERRGDVLLHVNKALERSVPLEPEARAELLRIDDSSLGIASVGQMAPPFALRTAEGKRWNLADFRGKSAVVLVFIYGDG